MIIYVQQSSLSLVQRDGLFSIVQKTYFYTQLSNDYSCTAAKIGNENKMVAFSLLKNDGRIFSLSKTSL
jgi:hypothetical protein